MPSSSIDVVSPCLHLAWEVVHELDEPKVLDVGVGNGKYGLLVKEYVHHNALLIGVEPERSYQARFPWLASLYGGWVFDVPIQSLIDGEGGDIAWELLDVCLMIDVLEHLDGADAERVLRFIPCPIVICTPVVFFQNPEADELPYEKHRSLWTADRIRAIRPLDAWLTSAETEHGAVIVRTAAL
jgi:hypothetical protein